MAKLVVMQHRVDSPEVKLWDRLCNETLATAKWIARATWAASNCDDPPYRDTEASQWRAAAYRKKEKAKKAARKAAAADEDRGCEVDDGGKDMRGHNPVKVLQLFGIRSGWRCTLCRMNS